MTEEEPVLANGTYTTNNENGNDVKDFRPTAPSSSDDPRIPVSSDRFPEYVLDLRANGGYKFSQLYYMISRDLCKTYNHSRTAENAMKNRYHNIPSYDDTRVILEYVEKDVHSDYINANYIDGFENKKEYIAAQGPLPETVFDFWRMAWENDVATIVMLTNPEEKGRVKCAVYWPETNAIAIQDFVITNTDIQEFPDHVVRTFHITRTGQGVEKVIKQFHYISWPDFGVPQDPSGILAFIRKVNSWKVTQTPTIVHCSAGVGRTGTYITIDTQIKNIKKYHEINIFENVTQLREQRCMMVQTEDQYIFIHDALIDHLESGRTEVEANDLADYIRENNQTDSKTGMSGLVDEFVRLTKTDKKDKFTDANKTVNHAKNRYQNIFPYDDTRVRLVHHTGVDGSDYINANYIDSYMRKNSFIATQAPLENTVVDFWRMVWETNSATVVMLVREDIEPSRVHVYWPPKSATGKISALTTGSFIVEVSDETTYGEYILRQIKITNTVESSSRLIYHYQYTSWPTVGSPESGSGLVDLIGQVQKWNASRDNTPVVIHCSGGVGRTGVFIALNNLIERVKSEHVIDVYQTIKRMRQQRTAMVQTKDQYEFVYNALQEYLASFEIYANIR